MINEEQKTEPIEKIEHISLVEEMRVSYIDYSMSVIVGRALPDVRDGLKPVHRRVLFAMRELGNTHNHPYKKSARVVGDVIGKYHPHGDTAVYDTIVRLAQDFSLRYPLVDGQGNFGSIDGDPPAAMRYTEVRMNQLAEELLADIDKETVDFGPNYDESLEQPLVMPSKIPNLLLNGSTGIAVGMATNIPPHNICELVDALIDLINNPSITVDQLMEHIKGPDFPTGGIICGTAAIKSMYRTGRGQMQVRGRAVIEENRQGKEVIIITEIPYNVNKSVLIEHMAKLVQDKVLDGISDLRDESNKEGIRIVVELKRGVIPKVILNNIYQHTQMQTTFGAIMLALDNGKPKILNLKDLLHCFTNHRFDVITRRTKFELSKAEARAHILEGLKIALDNLDAVVKTIRKSGNRDEARTGLMTGFNLSEIQANAILDMRLYQLTGLERNKVDNEYLEIIKLISHLKDLLANENKIYDVIKNELIAMKQKYGDMRRTDIAPDENEINMEDLVADRGCIITASHEGYIKRVPIDTYKEQRRGGKGVAGMATKEEDYVEHLFVAHMHDFILFFTSQGRVHWKKLYEIPEASRIARGKAIVNLLNITNEEKIAAMIKVREFSDSCYLVMATERGVVKKTDLSAFGNPRSGGIIAINIDNGDSLIGVKPTTGNNDVMLTTQLGKSIRFSESKLRGQGRATRGVKGITLSKTDRVESLEIVNTEATFLTCTENGYGKRSSFDDYRRQGRGGRGIIAIRTSERNGKVVGAHAVLPTDFLILVTAKGKMIRMAIDDIRVIGRATQGVKLINLDEGDKLVSATAVQPDDIKLEDSEIQA
ncbi:MAG: DNA gyrase subunit A [Lentisphaerae bacterium]|nr:DNA gyrase subunit A [Lentisphaerota bacterium]